jgi:hypothetical protein
VTGPIFVSHSSEDRDEANALAYALRQAFSQRVRTFNTSSGTAIQAGEKWRQVILDAIRDASVVVLWCTPAATKSKEVAFEIGASFAYGKQIIPCAVHMPPSRLPWSLDELQAPALETESGWLQLAEAVANSLEYNGGIDKEPLLQLAKKFQAPSDALDVKAIGRTLEFKNTSNAPISNLDVLPVAGETPEWLIAIAGQSLQAGQGRTLLRQPAPDSREFDLSWDDVAGARHQRRVTIGGTTA